MPHGQRHGAMVTGMCRSGAVILAAGSSTRFGSDKRHHRLAGNRTMLATTLAIYQSVFARIFLVLQPDDRSWASELSGVQPVYAADSGLGMGHSLAAGIRAARHLDLLFVALADMPHVQPATLRRLVDAMPDTRSIVQPAYLGTPGHPVGFGSAYFDELERLSGDVGARQVLAAHPNQVTRLDFSDAGIVADIDVPP